MRHCDSPQKAKRWCNKQRKAGKNIGFVATMGALHAGHLALVERARTDNDLVVASIFVNPLQFNNAADLKKYPRDQAGDFDMLKASGTDMVFTGEVADFFPDAEDISTFKPADAGIEAQGLEGAFRPGHFEGVREIVSRLFQTVGACRAYFGQKDFQQTLVVKRLAADLKQEQDLAITVVVCPTVRAESGLALSSRNQRLSDEQKTIAIQIHQALLAAKAAWQSGERNGTMLSKIMRNMLGHPQFTIEYAEIRDPEHWTAETPKQPLKAAQALIAAEIGGVRLIDNLRL